MVQNTGTLSKSALRRKRDKELRYKSILNSAEHLFAEKGYHQTSMEQIGDRAEVTAGAIYSYFRNKEDLLLTLMREGGYFFRKGIGDAFKTGDQSLDGIKNAGLSFFKELCQKKPEKMIIMFRESVGQGEEVEEQRKRLFFQLISDVKDALLKISKGQGIKYFSELSAEIMAVSIVGIYEKMACYYLIWDDRVKDLGQIADEAVMFTLGGVNSLIEK